MTALQSKRAGKQYIRTQMDALLISSLLLSCFATLSFAQKPTTPATITSDELELRNNGALTIFTGHVVLTQDPYQVQADRMVRTRSTGIADAMGHVEGTWVSPKGEKVKVLGDTARFDPALETLEVWGPGRVHVSLEGEKGSALFHGDRGWVFTHQPGRAKLIGQVTGHVVPDGAL